MLNTAKVIKIKNLTHDVFEIVMETGKEFTFNAGQFINIKIEDQDKPCFRGYSLASGPNGKKLKLCVKIVENGRGSNWLHSRKPNDTITFLGPIGKLVFATPPERNALIIATGTGIAPFIGIIKEELEKKNKQRIELIFGVRHKKDIIYNQYFEELANKYQNFTYHLTLSRPESPKWNGNIGRVTTVLKKLEIDEKNTDIYACGLKPMLTDVKKLLVDHNIPEESIHFEQYD